MLKRRGSGRAPRTGARNNQLAGDGVVSTDAREICWHLPFERRCNRLEYALGVLPLADGTSDPIQQGEPHQLLAQPRLGAFALLRHLLETLLVLAQAACRFRELRVRTPVSFTQGGFRPATAEHRNCGDTGDEDHQPTDQYRSRGRHAAQYIAHPSATP